MNTAAFMRRGQGGGMSQCDVRVKTPHCQRKTLTRWRDKSHVWVPSSTCSTRCSHTCNRQGISSVQSHQEEECLGPEPLSTQEDRICDHLNHLMALKYL